MQRKSLSSFKQQAIEKHGVFYDYSLVDYINAKTKVEIICPHHGSFRQQPATHLRGQGCPECAGYLKLTKNDFITRAKEIHKNFYDYSDANYINFSTKVKIVCPAHGVFEQTPVNHLNNHGRPSCAKSSSGPTKEAILYYIILKI